MMQETATTFLVAAGEKDDEISSPPSTPPPSPRALATLARTCGELAPRQKAPTFGSLLVILPPHFNTCDFSVSGRIVRFHLRGETIEIVPFDTTTRLMQVRAQEAKTVVVREPCYGDYKVHTIPMDSTGNYIVVDFHLYNIGVAACQVEEGQLI